jgi:hypothetical protein
VVVIVSWLDLQLAVQSVSITTKVVSLNPVHGDVYPIQHYVIKFVSDLLMVLSGYSGGVKHHKPTNRVHQNSKRNRYQQSIIELQNKQVHTE